MLFNNSSRTVKYDLPKSLLTTMGTNTRYNKLRNKLKTDFSRNRTIGVDTAADSRETVLNLADYEAVGNDSFLESGPFNHVTVRNFGPTDIEVYLSSDRQVSVRVPAPSGAVRVTEVTDVIPKRYVSFVEVENLSGSDPADVEIQVGNEVDGVELDLLQMSGLLDIQE